MCCRETSNQLPGSLSLPSSSQNSEVISTPGLRAKFRTHAKTVVQNKINDPRFDLTSFFGSKLGYVLVSPSVAWDCGHPVFVLCL